MYSSLLSLIKDCSALLQQELNEIDFFFHSSSSKKENDPKSSSIFHTNKKIEIENKLSETFPKPLPQRKSLKKNKPEIIEEKSFISLESPSTVERKDFNNLKKIMGKQFPSLKYLEISIPICIFAQSNSPAQRTFLENLVKVISQRIAPTSLSLFTNLQTLRSECKKHGIKLILISTEKLSIELNKIYPNYKIHQLAIPTNPNNDSEKLSPKERSDYPALLPLAPLDSYISDQTLKQSLWTALQQINLKSMPL